MRRGLSAIELMIAMIVFALILTALWQVYSTSQRNAREILVNHTINDETDRTLLKIMDDVRECNFIYDNCPPAISKSEVDTLQTRRENYLMFMKVLYDFSKDPMDLPEGEVNFTQNKVEYYVEKRTKQTRTAPGFFFAE
jgi:prepilin-type N-terminal cleavage/methylation domain-containing protein